MRRSSRAWMWWLAGILGAFVLAGCDLGPTWTFTVTTTVDAVDAAPGDGVCEATPGAGDCSLRCTLTGDGSLWCWGRNDLGALGNGTTTTSYVPLRIPGPGRA